MSSEQFSAIMPYICADLIKTIAAKKSISDKEAASILYGSQVYASLENETTKIWQYSSVMLYSLLEQELQTGVISYPDV